MAGTKMATPSLQAVLDAFNSHDDLFEFADGKISRKDSFWKITD